MFSQRAIIILSLLAVVVQGQFSMKVHAIQYEPVDDSKFLGRVGKHFSLLHSFTDYLMVLFQLKDAELMSKNAKQHIMFDMQDKSTWYNESIKDVNIPTYQDLQLTFNGGDTPQGNLTLDNLNDALKTYCDSVWTKVTADMTKELADEFVKHEIYDDSIKPPLATNKMDEEGYNNISTRVFPEVKPFINMINNTKGPFSLHMTLDYHGEAEKYKLYENQTDVLLMGYNNQTWSLSDNSNVTEVQYNNSYVIYADPTVTQGNIIQFPTPANYFQPTIDRPFWLGWQKVGNPEQNKIAFAYTNPRSAYDSSDRYGPNPNGARNLTLLLGSSLSMVLALII